MYYLSIVQEHVLNTLLFLFIFKPTLEKTKRCLFKPKYGIEKTVLIGKYK